MRVGQAGDWVCSLAGECEAGQDSGYRDTEDNFIGRRKRQTDRRCKAKFNLNTLKWFAVMRVQWSKLGIGANCSRR